MSRASDVDQLVRKACKEHKFDAVKLGREWVVTNSATGRTVTVPLKAIGQNLSSYRNRLTRLAHPLEADAPTTADDDAQEDLDMASPIQTLLERADASGVAVRIRGGLLQVSAADPSGEALARLIRDRAPEVYAHFAPATHTESESMPTIMETAHITPATPARDLLTDARLVWDLVRDEAADRGDKPGSNAGQPGVLWHGAMGQQIRTLCPEWDDEYVRQISVFLTNAGLWKCQDKQAKPSPIWWLRNEWRDVPASERRPVPTPPPAKAAKAAKTTSPAAAAPAPPAPVDDAEITRVIEILNAARAATARITVLEDDIVARTVRIHELSDQVTALEEEVTDLRKENAALADEAAKVPALEAKISRYEAAAAIFRGDLP
ncbi:hypothetical protein [Streptosporangium sp. NPDC002524]|uniref:hypothetical protein n=1 Tax=Streptosporangium sp. NPDC002524 TaxID=3154537 RepID=UPI0033314FFE